MSQNHVLRPQSRIHGELLKLGIEIGRTPVGRHMLWRPQSFLKNRITDIAAGVRFVAATATSKCLYAAIVFDHNRRRVIHFDLTQNPTQARLARRITEASPWNSAPRYLLRDQDTRSSNQPFRSACSSGTFSVSAIAFGVWLPDSAEALRDARNSSIPNGFFRHGNMTSPCETPIC